MLTFKGVLKNLRRVQGAIEGAPSRQQSPSIATGTLKASIPPGHIVDALRLENTRLHRLLSKALARAERRLQSTWEAPARPPAPSRCEECEHLILGTVWDGGCILKFACGLTAEWKPLGRDELTDDAPPPPPPPDWCPLRQRRTE